MMGDYHMSLRLLCTPETVFTVLSPLKWKVPPLNCLVKLLLQGKYFSWISKSAGLLLPQFMLLVRYTDGPTLSPGCGYSEQPIPVTWNSVFFWYRAFSELGSTPSFSSRSRMTLLFMSFQARLKSFMEPTISEQVGTLSFLMLVCSGRRPSWAQTVPYSWLLVPQRVDLAVRVKALSPDE